MFEQLIESSTHRERRGRSLVFMSLMIHLIILGVLIVVPLVYYQGLPEYEWVRKEELLTKIAIPDPPKLEPVVASKRVQVVKLDPAQFVAPTEIPREIPAPLNDIPEFSSLNGIIGESPEGFTGGIPEGIPGVPFGEEIGVLPTEAPEPPPLPTKKKPIRIGGSVHASRLVYRVEPEYPELAKRARVSGLVVMQVIVNEGGAVEEVRIVRGHPLLNDSALRAVRQWRYSPYLLNGEPIPVTATVTVRFVLH